MPPRSLFSAVLEHKLQLVEQRPHLAHGVQQPCSRRRGLGRAATCSVTARLRRRDERDGDGGGGGLPRARLDGDGGDDLPGTEDTLPHGAPRRVIHRRQC